MIEGDAQPFEDVLGDTSELRVLEKLLAMPSFEFSVSELAKIAGLSRLSIYRGIGKFVRWDMMIELERGKRTRYQLNPESPLVQALYDLNHALVLRIAEEAGEIAGPETIHAIQHPYIELAYAREAAVAFPGEREPIVLAVAPPKRPSQIAIA